MKHKIYHSAIFIFSLFLLSVESVSADLMGLDPIAPEPAEFTSTQSILIVGGVAVIVSLIALLILLKKRR